MACSWVAAFLELGKGREKEKDKNKCGKRIMKVCELKFDIVFFFNKGKLLKKPQKFSLSLLHTHTHTHTLFLQLKSSLIRPRRHFVSRQMMLDSKDGHADVNKTKILSSFTFCFSIQQLLV